MRKLIVCLLLFSINQGFAQNITQMEYFIDADPGYGSGISVSFTEGNPVTVDFSVNLSSNSDGFHFLSLRAKDANNHWGVVGVRPFYKETLPTASLPNITAMEYFIDNDLGYGNGTPITFTASSSVSQSFQIPLPNGILDGFHFLSLRAKDANNHWGVVGVRPFYKETLPTPSLPNITAMEYFIDNDLGYGNGTPVTFTASSSVSQSFQIPLPNGMSDGFHFLSLRAKDANNKWSIVGVRPFYKETLPTASLPNITAMEYFIDNDLGYGNGTPVTFAAGTNVSKDFTVNLGSLSNGTHTLFFRAKDINNKWTVVGNNSFIVQDNVVVIGSIPTQWCLLNNFNIPITLTGTYAVDNVFTAQLSDALGSFASPTTIGTLNSTTAGTLVANVPNTVALGSGYQLRVISSSPVVTNSPTKAFTLISICPPPCSETLTLINPTDNYSSGIITKEVNATTGRITATNQVTGSGTKVTYRAGKSITLNAGFKADGGTVFKTEFGGCAN